jgi:hypothetical protein
MKTDHGDQLADMACSEPCRSITIVNASTVGTETLFAGIRGQLLFSMSILGESLKQGVMSLSLWDVCGFHT